MKSIQREKEQELLFIGHQFRKAIALYYERTPGTIKKYPDTLDDLLEDKRYVTHQRYLRKIYRDPMTGKNKWGIVRAPGAGIMGVYSLSKRHSIKTGNFASEDKELEGVKTYREWKFVYMAFPGGQKN